MRQLFHTPLRFAVAALLPSGYQPAMGSCTEQYYTDSLIPRMCLIPGAGMLLLHVFPNPAPHWGVGTNQPWPWGPALPCWWEAPLSPVSAPQGCHCAMAILKIGILNYTLQVLQKW